MVIVNENHNMKCIVFTTKKKRWFVTIKVTANILNIQVLSMSRLGGVGAGAAAATPIVPEV